MKVKVPLGRVKPMLGIYLLTCKVEGISGYLGYVEVRFPWGHPTSFRAISGF